MSVTRAPHDASFAKLVSLVAYRDSRHIENKRFLRDLLVLLALNAGGLGTSTAK